MSAAIAGPPTPDDTRSECSVLITDLDNTLWDWFDIWYRSFSALLDGVVQRSGLLRETLEKEIREVHQKRRTSEYAFLLQELPSLRSLHRGQDIPTIYDESIHAHRKARKAAVRLYPHVRETLTQVRKAGALVIGHTESMAFYTADRLRRTGLDGTLDFLYSAPDHEFPAGISPEQLRMQSPAHYELRRTTHRHLPRGKSKPDPDLLQSILNDVGADRTKVVYVGDSRMKDVTMAQCVGVMDVWASYGEAQGDCRYELLRRVSHWPTEDVEREKTMRKEDVRPTRTISSFGELLTHFSFCPPATPTATSVR